MTSPITRKIISALSKKVDSFLTNILPYFSYPFVSYDVARKFDGFALKGIPDRNSDQGTLPVLFSVLIVMFIFHTTNFGYESYALFSITILIAKCVTSIFKHVLKTTMELKSGSRKAKFLFAKARFISVFFIFGFSLLLVNALFPWNWFDSFLVDNLITPPILDYSPQSDMSLSLRETYKNISFFISEFTFFVLSFALTLLLRILISIFRYSECEQSNFSSYTIHNIPVILLTFIYLAIAYSFTRVSLSSVDKIAIEIVEYISQHYEWWFA